MRKLRPREEKRRSSVTQLAAGGPGVLAQHQTFLFLSAIVPQPGTEPEAGIPASLELAQLRPGRESAISER